MRTIEDNNKLIAEFMGLVRSSVVDRYWTEKNSEGIGVGQLKELRYDTDWNWLMKVVDRINALNNVLSINENYVYITNNERSEVLVDVVAGDMLEATYRAVVEFINYYNKQNDKI